MEVSAEWEGFTDSTGIEGAKMTSNNKSPREDNIMGRDETQTAAYTIIMLNLKKQRIHLPWRFLNHFTFLYRSLIRLIVGKLNWPIVHLCSVHSVLVYII